MGNRWIIALPRSYNTPYEKIGDETAELEVPFDIPDSWEWVRLGNIVNIVSARRVHQSDWRAEGVPFYRAREIVKLSDSGYVNNELFISQKLFDEYAVSGVPQPGDLMVTAVGTLGKTYIVQPGDRFYYKDASVICFENYGKVCAEYIKVLMATPYMMNQINDNASGTTVGTITIVRANNYLIPLPPLSEQERIVKFLSTLEPLLSSYNDKYTQLDALHTTFPSELKKSILQWAVQGRLVPQDPSDEPAEALLERIRGEKERLVREGKIKKDKHESVIFRRDNSHYEKRGVDTVCIDDALPFDIPETWCWTRLSSIAIKEVKRGKSPQYAENGSVYVFAQKCNVKSGGINMSLAKYLAPSAFSKYPAEEQMLDRDIIVNSTGGGTLGRIGIFHDSDRINDCPIVPDSHVTIVRTSCEFAEDYIFYVFKYYQPYLEALGEGSTNQTELKPSVIADLFVPVPPLSEQKRIVKALARVLDQLSLL